MAKLSFEKLIPLFEANEEFSLTESQYEKSVGKALPKDFYYLKNRSALAKTATEYGYSITVTEKTVCFQKTSKK